MKKMAKRSVVTLKKIMIALTLFSTMMTIEGCSFNSTKESTTTHKKETTQAVKVIKKVTTNTNDDVKKVVTYGEDFDCYYAPTNALNVGSNLLDTYNQSSEIYMLNDYVMDTPEELAEVLKIVSKHCEVYVEQDVGVNEILELIKKYEVPIVFYDKSVKEWNILTTYLPEFEISMFGYNSSENRIGNDWVKSWNPEKISTNKYTVLYMLKSY